MLWLIELVVGIGFLISVAMSIEAAATRRQPRSFLK